jgi:hypothetical protein
MSLNKEREKKGIFATLILEIVGRPPEYLIETLTELIKNMGEEKGVEVLEKRINEPILMKDSKDYYTTFAEVDVEVEDILYLAIIMFKYMPAHIEVIEPELIALTNNGWTDILSELTRRLHGYDEIARMMQVENSQMQKKLNELLPKKAFKEATKEMKEDIPEKEEVVEISKKKGKKKN